MSRLNVGEGWASSTGGFFFAMPGCLRERGLAGRGARIWTRLARSWWWGFLWWGVGTDFRSGLSTDTFYFGSVRVQCPGDVQVRAGSRCPQPNLGRLNGRKSSPPGRISGTSTTVAGRFAWIHSLGSWSNTFHWNEGKRKYGNELPKILQMRVWNPKELTVADSQCVAMKGFKAHFLFQFYMELILQCYVCFSQDFCNFLVRMKR